MNGRPVEPTSPEYEREKGRIPVWLLPEQVRMLIAVMQEHHDDADTHGRDKWGDVQFRLAAALHKSSVE